MTNDFVVMGEHRDDNTRLLVLGSDGRHYSYVFGKKHLSRVEPGEQWIVTPGSEDATVAEPKVKPKST